MSEKSINDITNMIIMLDTETLNEHHLDTLDECIQRLRCKILTIKARKRLCEKYSNHCILIDLIPLINISSYDSQRADYWINFNYVIKVGDLITFKKSGTGPYEEILAPIRCITKSKTEYGYDSDYDYEYDSDSDAESVRYHVINQRTVNVFHEILDKKIEKSILEQFIIDLFSNNSLFN